MPYIIGILATVVAAVLSGFSNIWLERFLKRDSDPLSLSIRNIQLSIYGIFFCCLLFIIDESDYKSLTMYGLFDGFNWVVWLTIWFQAVGGLLVAATMKHADNIIKGFATSFSMVLCAFLAERLFGESSTSPLIFLGIFLVVLATFIFTRFK